MISLKEKLERSLLAHRKIDANNCWIWTGYRNHQGYGLVRFGDYKLRVHRAAAFLWLNFDLNSNLQILHKNICHNTSCFNPEHIYAGTHQHNMRDVRERGSHVKEYCNRGHLLEETRTTKENGKTFCSVCRKINQDSNNVQRIFKS